MTIRKGSSAALEFPVLRVALLGFSADEHSTIESALRRRRDRMRWALSTMAEADAWCANGSGVRALADGTVEISGGLSSGRPIRLHLDEVDWPVAFSRPLPAACLKHALAFDAGSPESLDVMLWKLEGRLRPLVVQYYLASRLVDKSADMRSAVFHVTVNGKLYAVVSSRTGAGVWPIADPAELPSAVWSRRPDSADAIPSNFVRLEFSQLMWQYGTRTLRDCLPPRYRTSRLYLRRPPTLPLRLLDDATLLLVRELGREPGTLGELQQRTGLPAERLARLLGAFYLVGSITSDAARGTPIEVVRPGAEMTVRLRLSAENRAFGVG
jgi:hypothetical protein